MQFSLFGFLIAECQDLFIPTRSNSYLVSIDCSLKKQETGSLSVTVCASVCERYDKRMAYSADFKVIFTPLLSAMSRTLLLLVALKVRVTVTFFHFSSYFYFSLLTMDLSAWSQSPHFLKKNLVYFSAMSHGWMKWAILWEKMKVGCEAYKTKSTDSFRVHSPDKHPIMQIKGFCCSSWKSLKPSISGTNLTD